MKSLKQLLDEKTPSNRTDGRQEVNKYVSREFQDYGYRLAAELGDIKHKSLYMRLSKTVDRAILEACKRFVMDSNADSKGALFMWKLKQLNKK